MQIFSFELPPRADVAVVAYVADVAASTREQLKPMPNDLLETRPPLPLASTLIQRHFFFRFFSSNL